MTSIKQDDALEIIANFQKKLISDKPTVALMYDDVRMMHFKIRPLSGDILNINMQDTGFIETLWNLGKLEELFQNEYYRLPIAQRKIFFTVFDRMHQKYQEDLNRMSLSFKKEHASPTVVEMEIFKDTSRNVN